MNIKRKKVGYIALMLAVFLLFLTSVVFADENAPEISAEAAVLVDMSTGNVLYSKNADKQMYPASTTKVMTALLTFEAIEKGEASLENTITVTEEDLKGLAADGSSIGLKEGEIINLDGLLKGLLIASGNDAAAVIANHIGGNVESFVSMMNDKAAQLGLRNTHFVNPHGLHSEEHYTTAEDLAHIACAAMKYEGFRNIVDCAHIKIPPTNITEERYYINTNNLVSKLRYPDYYYDKATGIKTGSTSQAGNCLVSSAKDGEKEFVAVVLKADSIRNSHNSSKYLLQYGIKNYASRQLANANEILGEVVLKQAKNGQDYLTVVSRDKAYGLMPKNAETEKVETVIELPEKIYAPVTNGQEIGRVRYLYDGQEIANTVLISNTDIERHPLGFLMSFGEYIWQFRTVKWIVYPLISALILIILWIIFSIRKKIKRYKRKKRRATQYKTPDYWGDM